MPTRILTSLALCGLLAAGLSASPSSADDSDGTEGVSAVQANSPIDTDSDGVLDAPDAAAAAAGATAEDVPVEDLSKRTEAVTVVVNPDGTFTRKDFGEAVRIKRGDEWLDVDYNLGKRSDGSWAPKASPVDVSVGDNSAKEAARVSFNDGASLAVTWPTNLPEPTVDGGVATYKLSKATDLLVAVTGSGVNARIRLNEEPSADDPVFTFGLRAEGVEVSESGGGLKLADEDGNRVGGTSTLTAWDSKVDKAGEPIDIVPLEAELASASTSGDVTQNNLELTTPEGFLSDPETQYPVTIDPDISSLSRVRDTWVRQGNTAINGLDYRLIVGKTEGSSLTTAAQSYLQFDSSPIAGKEIISAQLGLYQYFAKTCSARAVTAWPISSAWDPNIVYTNRPGYVQSSGDTTTITTNRGFTGCGGAFNPINVTNIVDAWARGTYPDHGISLAVPTANVGDASYERRFCSFNPDTTSDACYDAARRPYLSITYNSRPVVTTTAPTVNLSSTPAQLTTSTTDPDGTAYWGAEFTIKRGSTVVWQGLSHFSTGTGAPKHSYLPTLPKGQYTVAARAYDGRLFSTSTTPSTSFTITSDTTDVLGDTFTAVTPTQVASVTVPGATIDSETGVLGTAEELVQIAGLAGVPDDDQTGHAAVVSLRTSGWSSEGRVSVVNPGGEPPSRSSISIEPTMSPSTPMTSNAVVELSDDGEVSVINTSTSPVTVAVSVVGRFEKAAPPEAPIVGPQVDPGVVAEEPTQGPATITFTPPVEPAYTLAAPANNEVAMTVDGTVVGHYKPNAIDNVGETVPATISNAAGGDLVVSLNPTPDTEFPVSVAPTFEASNPSNSTVQELYPEPANSADPDDEPLTPEDVVEIVDGASQEFVEDLQDPEAIEGESGQMATMASAPAKARVPHWTRSNGSKIWPKNYVYDPKNNNNRNPARKGWHDYCTGLPVPGPDIPVRDSWRFTYMAFNGLYRVSPWVSFKGPCARHDLCIQYKQAPHRFYCDDEFKTHIRMNCRYYIRTDLYPDRKSALDQCYSKASLYHYGVRFSTGGKTDSGKWGHSQYNSTWDDIPQLYRYDDWIQ